MGVRGHLADRLLLQPAREQHGVVSRRQLLELGISSDVIRGRVAATWLRPLHRGVYVVGPVRSERTH